MAAGGKAIGGPTHKIMTEGAFGLEWRKHTPNNNSLNYRFDTKGTGAPGSEKELEISGS